MRVIAAPHAEGSRPLKIKAARATSHAIKVAICASLRRVTAESTSFRKAAQGVRSVVTVSAASSDDAQRFATLVHCPGLCGTVGDIFASRTGSGNEPVIRGIEASALLGT